MDLTIGAATRSAPAFPPIRSRRGHFVDAPRGVAAIVRGIGGPRHWEEALDLTRQALAEELGRQRDAREATRAGLELASQRLCEVSAKDDGLGLGPRTATVTAIVIAPPRATVLHIGEHHAYVLRHGSLRRLSADHTLRVETSDGEPSSVAKRALGPHADDRRFEEIELVATPGDRFLLVDETGARVLADAMRSGLPRDAQESADWIAELACGRSKRKHATAIVIDLAGAALRF